MAATPKYYRLTIFARDGVTPLLTLSSYPSDTNCLLTEAPTGDGQRVDPIKGTTEVGAYTWRAWDRKESANNYTITKSLYDAFARNQVLSNVCVAHGSPDGSAWTAFHYGYLNAHRLETAGKYMFSVGDTDRREQQAELFKFVSERFNRVSCLIGGPIVAPVPVAHAGTPRRSWGPQMDYGPARMVVIGNSGGGSPNPANLVTPTNRVTLSLSSGILPPFYLGQQGSWSIPLPAGLKISTSAEEIDRLARPYFETDAAGAYRTTAAENSQPWGSFPGLEVLLTKVVGGAVTRTHPIAQATRKRSSIPVFGGLPEAPIGDYSALVANSNDWLIVAWDVATMGAQPALGTAFDVLAYPRAISATNRLHLSGHPLDLFTEAADESGVPWDAVTKAAVKAQIGALWYELGIDGPMKFSAFATMLKGSAGFVTRYGVDNKLEFVATRATAPASVTTVTVDHLYGDPRTGPRTVIFDVSEKSTINGVDYKTRSYRLWTPLEESDRPADGVLSSDLIVEGRRGDTAVYGERVLTYDVPGQIINSNGLLLWNQTGALVEWIRRAGEIIIDRVGWGALEGEVEVLPSVPGKVGEYWDLQAPHQVNAKTLQSPIAQRGGTRKVQIIGRTDLPEKSVVQLLDAGNLAQDPLDAPTEDETGEEPNGIPVPEIALAASVADPLTIATATITNAADIQSVGGDVWLEYAMQEAEPTGAGTPYGPILTASGETEINLPAIPSGTTIWVRGQTRVSGTAQFSDWSTWTSITLGPGTNGESGGPALTLSYTIDSAGVVDVTAATTGTSVKFALAADGDAEATDSAVRAATADSAAPFEATAIVTLAEGDVRNISAFAYDDLGNESIKVTISVTRTGGDTGDAEGRPGNFIITFQAQPPTVVRNVGAAFAVPRAAIAAAKYLNTSHVGKMRLELSNWVGANAGATIPLAYSLDHGSSFGEAGPFVEVDDEGYPIPGAWGDLVDAAKGDNVLFTWGTKGGSGAATFKIGNGYLESVSSDAPPDSSDPGDTGDYPSGGPLGNIILLFDALRMLDDEIAAGALASVHDYSASENDAAPSATYGQSAPTFVVDGFDGDRPSIRFDGNTNGLTCVAPTIDKFTAYVALANAVGEGTNTTGGAGNPNAPILMGTGQNPRASMRGDGKITVAVNPNVGDLNQQMSLAAWDGVTPRRHKWVWVRGTGSFYWVVDGTVVCSYTSASATLMTGFLTMVMGYISTVSALALAADVGVVLFYDEAHVGGISAPVDAVIDAKWGTGP